MAALDIVEDVLQGRVNMQGNLRDRCVFKYIFRKYKYLKSFLALLFLLIIPTVAYALEANEYRQFLGLDSRKVVWFIAQMHLFFGAFVLGVPLFAVIIEIVGWRSKDKRFDKLAYEFTSLLSVAYATTAALGGLFAFALFTLYPTFMGYMAGIFKDVMFIYALLFFGETFCLYLYYYGWDWLSEEAKGKGQKAKGIYLATKAAGGIIIFIGILFLLGFGGPHMRGDTRAFIALCLYFQLAQGYLSLRTENPSIYLSASF